MARDLRMSPARAIWLAGHAAVAEAQVHGDKALEALVLRGLEVEEARKSEHARERTPAPRSRGRKIPLTPMGKVTVAFDERVGHALARLGVPSTANVQRLADRVTELEKIVAGLTRRRAPQEGEKAPDDRS